MNECRAIAVLICCAASVLPAAAPKTVDPAKPKEKAVIQMLNDQSRIEYDPKSKVSIGYNGVIVTYEDATLSADKLTWDSEKGEALAEGNVRIQREGHVFTGDRIRYNFYTKEIEGGQFRTGQPPYFAVGRGLFIDQETQTYRASDVFITTDDHPGPSQGIKARRMTLVPGEYIEARHATFRVGGVPFFYLPYLRRSLGPRQNHFNVTPGYRSLYGSYLLGSYNWYWEEKLEGILHLDYRQKRGVGFGPDFQWDLGEYGQGEFRYYFTEDSRSGFDPRPVKISDQRQRIYFTHDIDITTNLTAKAVVRYQTDPYIVRDFFEGEYRKEIQPGSFLEVNQLWKNWSLDVLTQPRINDFFDTTERLPDLRLTGYRQQIGVTPLYYESESSLGYYHRRFAYDLVPDFEAWRGDSYHQILYPQTYFGWLNVTPRAGLRYTQYGEAHGPGGFTDGQERFVFNTGAEASMKVSRVFEGAESKFFEINSLRHIFQPSINYAYVPRPTERAKDLPQFDARFPSFRLLPIEYPQYNSIDTINSQNVVRFSVRNRIQTKRDEGIEDVVDWSVYTDYRLNRHRSEYTFSDLYSDLELKPRSWLEARTDIRYGIEEDKLKDLYSRVTFLPSDRWSLSLGQRYLADDPVFGRGYDVYLSSLYYKFNENWAGRMSHHYEARDGRLEEQYYTLYRDLRSWTAALTLRFRDQRTQRDDVTVAFTFSLKAFPRYSVGDDADRPALLLGY